MAAPAEFSRTPWTASGDEILDWSVKRNVTHHINASKPLYGDDELFGMDPGDLFQFIEDFSVRARKYGWSNQTRDHAIALIEQEPGNDETERYDFTENWGSLSYEEVKNHEEAYLFGNNRSSQDNDMAWHCLQGSLSKNAKKRMNIHKSKWAIQNPDDPNAEPIPSAMLYFKVLIQETAVDSNAKTSSIREQLADLSTYMANVGSDILKFNQHVQLLLLELAARGETTDDLLIHLFRAYQTVTDKKFVAFIAREREDWEMGRNALEPRELMNTASERYKTLRDSNQWCAPTPEDQKILALEAKVEAQEKKIKALKSTSSPKTVKFKEPPTGGGDRTSAKPAIMNGPPPDSKRDKPVKWNGHNWYWCCTENGGGKCSTSGAWRRHKPAQCKSKEELQAERKKRPSPEKKGGKPDRRLKLSKAMSARIIREDDAESDDE